MNTIADTDSTSPCNETAIEAASPGRVSSLWRIVGKVLLAGVGIALGAIAGGVIGLTTGLIQLNFSC
jgi:hypothetical protein